MRDAIPKRLYRGIRERYDPEKVGTTGGRQGLAMTDFTDCPWSALRFAHGRKGHVLVLHPPHDPESERPALRVTEEMWGLRDNGPKRYVVWGRFDEFLAAVIPAKELRKHVRAKGVVATEDEYKALVLERAINEWLAANAA